MPDMIDLFNVLLNSGHGVFFLNNGSWAMINWAVVLLFCVMADTKKKY